MKHKSPKKLIAEAKIGAIGIFSSFCSQIVHLSLYLCPCLSV